MLPDTPLYCILSVIDCQISKKWLDLIFIGIQVDPGMVEDL